MQPQQLQTILDILFTIGEGLEYLQTHSNAAVTQAVMAGRQAVTPEIEKMLGDTLARRINANALDDFDWLNTVQHVVEELANSFQPQNMFDNEFMNIMHFVWVQDERALLQRQLAELRKWAQSPDGKARVKSFADYFERFPLWGTLDLKKGDFNTLKRRAVVLKRHSYDFLWLYRRLGDYLSKRTLSAILMNWAVLNTSYLQTVKSIFPDYWEPDLFPGNKDDVLVDVGAYVGDSIAQYVRAYGSAYKKIYAYEVSPESCEAMRASIEKMGLHDVIIRNKGAGAQHGELFLSRSASDASANQLSADETAGQRIEVVPLDEDIEEKVTFLKMDIEGAEWDTLLGCRRIISEDHPKLAICVYHGYDDLWRIPALIDSMYPDYEFYLRHYGGNLIPTEFVLLCRPREKQEP